MRLLRNGRYLSMTDELKPPKTRHRLSQYLNTQLGQTAKTSSYFTCVCRAKSCFKSQPLTQIHIRFSFRNLLYKWVYVNIKQPFLFFKHVIYELSLNLETSWKAQSRFLARQHSFIQHYEAYNFTNEQNLIAYSTFYYLCQSSNQYANSHLHQL